MRKGKFKELKETVEGIEGTVGNLIVDCCLTRAMLLSLARHCLPEPYAEKKSAIVEDMTKLFIHFLKESNVEVTAELQETIHEGRMELLLETLGTGATKGEA